MGQSHCSASGFYAGLHLTVSHVSPFAGADADTVASAGAQQRGCKGEKSHGSGKAKGLQEGFFVGFFPSQSLVSLNHRRS